jgi:SAM-dependent methyltransferase
MQPEPRLETAVPDGAWPEFFAEVWERLGPETKTSLIDLLPDDWSFEGKRVLDFGCGAGRTLRHFLAEAETGEFWGADIDADSIQMIQVNLCPPLHVLRCAASPPLGLEHESFDLIWAISVFTHLTDNSLPWLLELHRLLKAGGLLIATYIGRWHSEAIAGEQWDENRVGMNVLRHREEIRRGGPMILMSDWWVRAHWGRAFEVLQIAPQIHNMSWVVLRKRDVELTTEDLERPEDHPREYVAARHNVRQVQREIEALQREVETAQREVETAQREVEFRAARVAVELRELQSEYERSLSWRLTRPIRAASQVARSLRSGRSPTVGSSSGAAVGDPSSTTPSPRGF